MHDRDPGIVRVLHEGGVLVAHVVAVASLALSDQRLHGRLAIRGTAGARRAERYELLAERCFLAGLVLLTVAVIIITIEIRMK